MKNVINGLRNKEFKTYEDLQLAIEKADRDIDLTEFEKFLVEVIDELKDYGNIDYENDMIFVSRYSDDSKFEVNQFDQSGAPLGIIYSPESLFNNEVVKFDDLNWETAWDDCWQDELEKVESKIYYDEYEDYDEYLKLRERADELIAIIEN
jgi:hypothetical protein